MSDMVEGTYGEKSAQLMYGVFTTPSNSIGGSAVCAFSMQSILDTFEGPFKEQETINSNWLSVPSLKVPEPRPGQCVNDSRTLPDVDVNFVKSHTLMDLAVPAFFTRPVLIRISSQFRFTMIAVDPQVSNSSFQKQGIKDEKASYLIKELSTASLWNRTSIRRNLGLS